MVMRRCAPGPVMKIGEAMVSDAPVVFRSNRNKILPLLDNIGIPEDAKRQIREAVEQLIEEAVEKERDERHLSSFNF